MKTNTDINNNCPIIGITGGIGSGKSYVAGKAQELLGVFYLDSDSLARGQMEPGGISYEAVVKEFGSSILLEDGQIDRSQLAKIVFNSDEARLKLNRITHPNAINAIKQECERLKAQGKYAGILVESALIIEANYSDFLDAIWYVHAPEDERVKRLTSSRGYSMEKIEAIFESQQSEESFRRAADSVIENSDSTGDAQLEASLRAAWAAVKK